MCVCVCVCIFLTYLLLTIMFHYRIAILRAKRFLLQTLVTPINTFYILYLSMPSYVLSSYLLNVHMEVLLLLNILLILTIYKIYKILKFIEFTNL